MSKPAQNVSTIELLKQILKLNFTLQNFSPVHISLYPEPEQQTADCLWNGGGGGGMLTVHKDSVIYVRETCWVMSSTICSSEHTLQKKERNIYQNIFTTC